MKIFNADGTEAEMCGNGIRCFAQWVFELGLVKQKNFLSKQVSEFYILKCWTKEMFE